MFLLYGQKLRRASDASNPPTTHSMSTATATCLCGACHLAIDSLVVTGLCHCTTCRKMKSSAYSPNTVVLSDSLHLIRGNPKTYVIPGDSGNGYTQSFCGDCGSVLWLQSPLPGMQGLKTVRSDIL